MSSLIEKILPIVVLDALQKSTIRKPILVIKDSAFLLLSMISNHKMKK
jgi:hypothetical protein